MLRGAFVTGTDTGVGKTVVSAALMHRWRGPAHGTLRYWKPVQTGAGRDSDTAEVKRLGMCTDTELLDAGARFHRPLSPHLAARLEGGHIDLRELVAAVRPVARGTRWIVEGAGGVLVPLNDSQLMIDLMKRLALPVVVAARSGLGTINHTLLTLQALRSRHLAVIGVVLVGRRNAPNRDAIERYGRVRVIGELPQLSPLTPARLRRWAASSLDRDGLLEKALR